MHIFKVDDIRCNIATKWNSSVYGKAYLLLTLCIFARMKLSCLFISLIIHCTRCCLKCYRVLLHHFIRINQLSDPHWKIANPCHAGWTMIYSLRPCAVLPQSFLGMLQRIKQVCSRRASGGQNYASLHMQRRTVRAQVSWARMAARSQDRLGQMAVEVTDSGQKRITGKLSHQLFT